MLTIESAKAYAEKRTGLKAAHIERTAHVDNGFCVVLRNGPLVYVWIENDRTCMAKR